MSTTLNAGLFGLLTAAVVAALPSSASAQDVAWAYVSPVGQGTSWQPSSAYQHTPTGDPVTIYRVGGTLNRFRVKFPGMAPAGGVALCSAKNGNHTAVVSSWTALGDDVHVTVETRAPNGGPANNGRFTVMFRRGGEDDQRQAYLWANDESAASYTPAPAYSWNGSRPDPTITRTGTGRYSVVLPGLGVAGGEKGHVQVTPYTGAGTTLRAKVAGWGHVGANVVVEVRCYDDAGQATDGMFTLSYNETAAPIAGEDGSGAHVWANNSSAATSVSYTPTPEYTDSNGTFGPPDSESVTRFGVGVYRVHLPNVVFANSSTVQVTAYGPDASYATVTNWNSDGCGGSNVNIETFDPSGNPADSRFTMLYLTNRPVVAQELAWAYVNPNGQGATWSPWSSYQYASSGGAITVDRDPTQQNRFLVTVPGIKNDGIALATAYGGNHTAVVNGWSQANDDVRIAVELFDPAGNPANDARFLVEYRRGGNNRNREAYLYANQQSAASYTPSTYWSWNANRPDPTINRVNTGTYNVVLPGLAPQGNEFGNVQVTPYGSSMLRTAVAGWTSIGDDVLVTVLCTDENGVATDGRFLLSYNETAAPISIHKGSGAHVWADDESSASYTPAPAYTDSNGTVGPANSELVERVAVGRYRVLLPNVAPNSSATVQVTAYGWTAAFASVDYFNGNNVTSGTQVLVETFDANGAPFDSQFTLRYLTNLPATGEAAATNAQYGSGCHGLVLEALSRPVSCMSWDLGLTGVPPGTVVGVLQLDLAEANIPLAAIGAPGCSVYTGGTVTEALLQPLPDPLYSFEIPPDPVFIGLSIYAQAGVLTPGINGLGIATSNGVEGVVGDI